MHLITTVPQTRFYRMNLPLKSFLNTALKEGKVSRSEPWSEFQAIVQPFSGTALSSSID
jgi:hypothetical protein